MDIVIIEEKTKELFYSKVTEYASQGYEIKWESFVSYYASDDYFLILAVKGEKKQKFSRSHR